LVLLSSFSLPKRGPGLLDLAHIDDKLNQAATAAGHQIDVAWHSMLDGGHELAHQLGPEATAGLSSALHVVALWLVPSLLVGASGLLPAEEIRWRARSVSA
jgi:hypothetical protein